MKVLFTHSYFLAFDAKQLKQQQPYPPLATMQAASVLKQHGFEVALHDVMFETSAASIRQAIENFSPQAVVIYDDGFNYLTKMCLTNMRHAAFEMIGIAKQSNCKVIVSSSDATDHCIDYLNEGADFIILGEGELTLLELTEKLKSKETDFYSVAGLAFIQDEKVFNSPKREVMKNLDALPFPLWDLIDIDSYKNAWHGSKGFFSINMSTTRGCPFKCNWCAKPIYGNRYNVRSPQHVVDEIKLLKKKLGIHHIWFCDDIFGLKPGWINEFANLVEKENLKIPFKIQCRADLLLQENNIRALARAGCDEVWIGAESGSQKILDAMDKGITVEQIYSATRLLKKHKIKPCFFLQFGYPGENKKDIDKTISMVMELMPHDIGVSVSYPLPGTKFYETVKEELTSKSNWTDSDELALMFNNTYPPGFYKALHRYIHKSYRTRQGVIELKNIFLNPGEITQRRLKKIAAIPYHIPGKVFFKREMNKYFG